MTVLDLLQEKLVTVERTQWNETKDQTICYGGTCLKLLDHLQAWAISHDAPPVMWISGLAGTGKTTILRTFCRQLNPRLLGRSYFLSRARRDDALRDPRQVVQQFAYGLAQRDTRVRKALITAVEDDEDITNAQLLKQAETLLSSPLSSATWTEPLILVLDALDECNMDTRSEALSLISSIATSISKSAAPLKLLVTSRPDCELDFMFNCLQNCTHLDLHDSSSEIADFRADINIYLEESVGRLKAAASTHLWPLDAQIKSLCTPASHSFGFASWLVHNLRQQYNVPDTSMEEASQHRALSNRFENVQKATYNAILRSALLSCGSEKPVDAIALRVRHLVGSIVVLRSPMKSLEISHLLNTNPSEDTCIIQSLYPAFLWRKNEPIQVLPSSFPEYLLAPDRSHDKQLLVRVDESKQHFHLALCCVRVINQQSRHAVCSYKDTAEYQLGTRNIYAGLREETSGELRYACRHWIAHFALARGTSLLPSDVNSLSEALGQLCAQNLFYWLEIVNFLGVLNLSFKCYSGARGIFKVGCMWKP